MCALAALVFAIFVGATIIIAVFVDRATQRSGGCADLGTIFCISTGDFGNDRTRDRTFKGLFANAIGLS